VKEVKQAIDILYLRDLSCNPSSKIAKVFLYLLIFKKEDMVSKSLFNSLYNHFNLKQIISLKKGVLWKIKVNSGNIESVLIKILKSVIRNFF